MLIKKKKSLIFNLIMVVIIVALVAGIVWIVYDNFFSKSSIKISQQSESELDVLADKSKKLMPLIEVAKGLTKILDSPDFKFLKINVTLPIRAKATGNTNPFVNYERQAPVMSNE